MNELRARIFGLNVAPGSASDSMRGDSRDHELTPYPGEGDGKDWDFIDVLVVPHVDVRASLRLAFNAIRQLCSSANVAVPEDTSGFFSLALQNLNSTT